ncbi:MAG: hypothetical protein KAW88_07900 [Candidatus Cloacimonetes bacterium]|nr:hypothetical protein [Candidatus Cloacimonadota bacterium]
MRKGIFLQIVIIIIILVGWNLLHLGYNYQKQVFEGKISSIPMILFSKNINTLDSLNLEINRFDYIKEIKVECDSIVAEKIISSYGLEQAKTILESYTLPCIMKIYFKGQNFKTQQKTELEKLISDKYRKIVSDYNHNLWKINRKKIELLTKAYYAGNGIFIVFLLFISVFLRIHFEMKSNEYWKVFRASGGKRSLRKKQFLLNSFWICLVPIILNVGAYFIITYFKYLNIIIDYRLFGIEFGTLLLSTFITRISLGKNI